MGYGRPMGKRSTCLVAFVRSAVLASAILAEPRPAAACAEIPFVNDYATAALPRHAIAAVVKIETKEPLGPPERYGPPFRASATVVKPLKGKLRRANAIEIVTARNARQAAECPVDLAVGETYLVFLDGSESPYTIPRFGGFHVSDQDERFRRDVEAIEKVTSQGCGCMVAGGASREAWALGALAAAAAALCRRRAARSSRTSPVPRPLRAARPGDVG
jgi:hypothetical protein